MTQNPTSMFATKMCSETKPSGPVSGTPKGDAYHCLYCPEAPNEVANQQAIENVCTRMRVVVTFLFCMQLLESLKAKSEQAEEHLKQKDEAVSPLRQPAVHGMGSSPEKVASLPLQLS